MTPQQAETILQSHAEGSSLRGIARVGKGSYNAVVSVVRAASQTAQMLHNHDKFIEALVVSSEGKTDCKLWYTDD